MRNTIVLIVLDGWGVGPKTAANAIDIANPQTIEYIKHNFPSGTIQASGISAGLPWGEEGNSEVGHLTMGIGRVIYQHYPRISLSIRNGSFMKNKVVTETLEHAVKNKGSVHLMGLIGVIK